MYHHANKSWTSCYDDNCPIHLTEKEGAGYFPKREKNFSQYPRSDDRNFMHKETSWRDCLDPYCATHLDKKQKQLSFQKSGDYIMTLQDWVVNKELAENAKEYDPLWTEVFNVQASEEEGAPVITWRQIQWDDLE